MRCGVVLMLLVYSGAIVLPGCYASVVLLPTLQHVMDGHRCRVSCTAP